MIWLEFLILAVLVLCAGPFILRWLDRCLVSLPAEKSCAEPHAEVIAMDAESISTEDLASVWEIGREGDLPLVRTHRIRSQLRYYSIGTEASVFEVEWDLGRSGASKLVYGSLVAASVQSEAQTHQSDDGIEPGDVGPVTTWQLAGGAA